jgi:hypothetical protein
MFNNVMQVWLFMCSVFSFGDEVELEAVRVLLMD